ncbi:LysE family translocator [Variovorax sp. J31P179]|uniref:LysE family translocator n=1 Tax=Variovorax sp. J31P179 TaxID=3053508 RepID=UPI0025753946|nr:LysE family translocator [Variovorax sp. J31P179]MDM0081618.1 LysE family translocator [Variovorax sp. J31P179]
MPDAHSLLLFVAAGLLLNLTPGPDVLYIVSHSLRSGARAGILAGFGITAGCFVHIVAAALGLSALMAASNTAFAVLKWVGAAYLLWVGVRMLFSRASEAAPALEAAAPASARSVFLGGFWTNALNPKVALFFLAFVPQFIAPGTDDKALAFFLLGVLFNFNAIFVNVAWALAAGWTARRVGLVQRGMHWLQRGAGALFVGFGLRLALSDSPLAPPATH